MIVAMVPSIIVDLGVVAAAVVSVITAGALVAHLRPVRWAASRLFGEPLTDAFTRAVSEIVTDKTAPITKRVVDVEAKVETVDTKVERVSQQIVDVREDFGNHVQREEAAIMEIRDLVRNQASGRIWNG